MFLLQNLGLITKYNFTEINYLSNGYYLTLELLAKLLSSCSIAARTSGSSSLSLVVVRLLRVIVLTTSVSVGFDADAELLLFCFSLLFSFCFAVSSTSIKRRCRRPSAFFVSVGRFSTLFEVVSFPSSSERRLERRLT